MEPLLVVLSGIGSGSHGALDGVHDMANMPLEDELVRDDLNKMMRQGSIGGD